MAIGKVNYKTGQNLEPIANAITSMNQSSTKKDKPIEMAQKIKAISTDATAVEGNVLNGQTFYSGGSKKTGSMPNNGAWTGRIGVNGKVTIPAGYHNGSGYVDQSITSRGSITPAVSVTQNNPMYVRMNPGAYFTNASSGYPETSVTLAQLRGAGMCLQSELTAMTTDRDNWKNVANSRKSLVWGYLPADQAVTLTIPFGQINNIDIRCHYSGDGLETFISNSTSTILIGYSGTAWIATFNSPAKTGSYAYSRFALEYDGQSLTYLTDIWGGSVRCKATRSGSNLILVLTYMTSYDSTSVTYSYFV